MTLTTKTFIEKTILAKNQIVTIVDSPLRIAEVALCFCFTLTSTITFAADQVASDTDSVESVVDVDDVKRAVLNRLMTDIQAIPERVQAEAGLSSLEISEIFLLLSNARSFTNDNVLANNQKMCASWKNSQLPGQARVIEAVQAYNSSVERNKYYMNRHYGMILLEIEKFLSQASWRSLSAYLTDRNTRMARVRSLTSSLELQLNQENEESLHARCGIN